MRLLFFRPLRRFAAALRNIVVDRFFNDKRPSAWHWPRSHHLACQWLGVATRVTILENVVVSSISRTFGDGLRGRVPDFFEPGRLVFTDFGIRRQTSTCECRLVGLFQNRPT